MARIGDQTRQKMKAQGFIPVADVAEALGVSRATVMKAIREGDLRAMDLAGVRFVKLSDAKTHFTATVVRPE